MLHRHIPLHLLITIESYVLLRRGSAAQDFLRHDDFKTVMKDESTPLGKNLFLARQVRPQRSRISFKTPSSHPHPCAFLREHRRLSSKSP